MNEDERVLTLENLKKNKDDLSKILMKLPISMRTEAMKKQKIELENKLNELDKAIDMFSRKQVFVKVNE